MVSHLVAFIMGALTGAVGKYLAGRFTDQRRRQEATKEAQSSFRRICEQMPELIAEMKEDLDKPENQFTRLFYVLPRAGLAFHPNERCFEYYEDRHVDLRGKIRILENHGYVFDQTTGNVPGYGMTEKFVALVLSS